MSRRTAPALAQETPAMTPAPAPVTATGKRRRHNPERRAFRGRSYRRGGRRVRDLRAALVRE